MNVPVLPLHMGALHPYEQLLVLLLAFGPFVLLAVVVVVRRRQDARDDAREVAGDEAPEPAADQRDR